jgi:hypothetical protein
LLNENEAIVSLAVNSHNLTNLAYFIEKISPIEQLQELIISGTTKQVPGKSYFIYQPSDLDMIATFIKMKRSNLTEIILPMTQQCKNVKDIDEFLGDNLRNALAQNPYITRFNIGRINILGVSPRKEKIIPRASVEKMLSKLHEPYHPDMLKQETEKTTISARKRKAHLLTVLSFKPTIDYTPHSYDCWQKPPFKTLKDCNDKFHERNKSQENSPSDDTKEKPANTLSQSNTLAPLQNLLPPFSSFEIALKQNIEEHASPQPNHTSLFSDLKSRNSVVSSPRALFTNGQEKYKLRTPTTGLGE